MLLTLAESPDLAHLIQVVRSFTGVFIVEPGVLGLDSPRSGSGFQLKVEDRKRIEGLRIEKKKTGSGTTVCGNLFFTLCDLRVM